MASYGGLTVLEISSDGKVKVRSAELGSSSLAALVATTHIYYTGLRRNTLEVLTDQNEAMKSKEKPNHQEVAESLHRIKDLGYRILDAIEREDFDAWGRMLDEHWQYKKRLSSQISLSVVDRLYDHVKENYCVLGGKIIGAGGGGFLMLYCPSQHKRLEQFMLSQGMPRLHYMVELEGSKVVANIASTKAMVFHSKCLTSEEQPPWH